PFELLGDDGCFDGKLVAAAPAEAAAEPRDVHDDVFWFEAEAAGNEALPARRNLCRRPHLHHAVLEQRGAVLRLERGVGEEGIVIGRLDDLRPLRERRRRRRARELVGLRRHLRAALGRYRTGVPLDLERVRRAERVPRRVGDDGNTRRQAFDAIEQEGITHTGALLHFIEVGAHDFAAERGAFRVGRVQHPRQLYVDAEERRAGHDLLVVYAGHARADQGEVFRVFQRRIGRRRERRGFRCELAVRRSTLRFRVNDRTLFSRTLGLGHTTGLRGRR